MLALFATTTNIQATDWSPVLVLENGDEILWKLDQVVEPKKRFLVNELRDLSKTHDGIKSFVTQFEIDCERSAHKGNLIRLLCSTESGRINKKRQY